MKALKFIAWSKSTRKMYQNHRARINEYANTLNTGDGCANQSTMNYVAYIDDFGNYINRKITVNEAEKLQGYPVDHTKYGKDINGNIYEMSNTQRYQQCGNGVASFVSAHILNTVLPIGDYDIFSLFSGVGGTELRLPKRFKVVAHCEYNRSASDVLRYHHSDTPNLGDVRKVLLNPDAVPNHNILLFTSPCQSWSEAGLRKGFDSEDGNILFQVFKIIEYYKPQYIFFENVKGLLTHKKGESFAEICKTISTLGYEFDFNLFNASNFGLPQIRNRMFLFGRRKNEQ